MLGKEGRMKCTLQSFICDLCLTVALLVTAPQGQRSTKDPSASAAIKTYETRYFVQHDLDKGQSTDHNAHLCVGGKICCRSGNLEGTKTDYLNSVWCAFTYTQENSAQTKTLHGDFAFYMRLFLRNIHPIFTDIHANKKTFNARGTLSMEQRLLRTRYYCAQNCTGGISRQDDHMNRTHACGLLQTSACGLSNTGARCNKWYSAWGTPSMQEICSCKGLMSSYSRCDHTLDSCRALYVARQTMISLQKYLSRIWKSLISLSSIENGVPTPSPSHG